MSASAKVDGWSDLTSRPKSVFGWPDWAKLPITQHGRDNSNVESRSPLRSLLAERVELLLQLQDENGIALEGVRVRIAAWSHRYLQDMTATFEVLDTGDRWLCINRIDFLPPAPHHNKHHRRFGISPEIYGSHIHRCEDNAKLGVEAFTPRENLPNAIPLDREPNSFKEVVDLISEHFNISGISELPAPDWNGELF